MPVKSEHDGTAGWSWQTQPKRAGGRPAPVRTDRRRPETPGRYAESEGARTGKAERTAKSQPVERGSGGGSKKLRGGVHSYVLRSRAANAARNMSSNGTQNWTGALCSVPGANRAAVATVGG